MNFKIALLFLILFYNLISCKVKTEDSSKGVMNVNKPSTLEEMKQTAKKLDETALNIANFKSISCPKYYSDLVEKNDIIHCFVSSLEPEALIPLLSQELEKFADVDMGWRMDVGIWTTFVSD